MVEKKESLSRDNPFKRNTPKFGISHDEMNDVFLWRTNYITTLDTCCGGRRGKSLASFLFFFLSDTRLSLTFSLSLMAAPRRRRRKRRRGGEGGGGLSKRIYDPD